MKQVHLHSYELFFASMVGVMRQIASLERKLKSPTKVPDAHSWERGLLGACGEMAAAKGLGMYWDGSVNTFRAKPDISSDLDLEIRTRSRSDGELIVRDRDKDEPLYILVTGGNFDYAVHGFMRGKDAKQEKWLRAPEGRPPAYFVPQSELTPIEEL